ncbi:MAG: hypothetical protein WA775_09810 [Psychroserpens sp.]|uniref:hypothetical protein n=1 Tax=Psychroserpens sp. TaxID=2020870 RepID=UPI003CAACEF0
MKYLILILTFFLSFNFSFSQVGVGTSDPKSTLDIEASSRIAPSNEDGILIPRADEFPASIPGADQDGMLLFITGSGTPLKGFYYWDHDILSWVALNDNSSVVRAKLSANTTINQGSSGSNANVIGWNKVVFDLETEDVNAEYDNTTGRFTAKKTGLYTVTASIVSTFNATDQPTPVGIAIYKNGNRWQKLDYFNTFFTDVSRTITTNIDLVVGEYIEIYLGFPETFADFNSMAEDKSRLIITSQD